MFWPIPLFSSDLKILYIDSLAASNNDLNNAFVFELSSHARKGFLSLTKQFWLTFVRHSMKIWEMPVPKKKNQKPDNFVGFQDKGWGMGTSNFYVSWRD